MDLLIRDKVSFVDETTGDVIFDIITEITGDTIKGENRDLTQLHRENKLTIHRKRCSTCGEPIKSFVSLFELDGLLGRHNQLLKVKCNRCLERERATDGLINMIFGFD